MPRLVACAGASCRRSALGLAGEIDLPVAQRLDVVGVGRPAPVPLLVRPTGLQLHGAQLVGHKCRARPEVVLLLGEQVPAEHGQLARDGDRGDLVAAAGADADEEGVQRARGFCRRPRGLHQHRPGVAAPDLADPPMVSGAEPRLAHTRIEAEVAHQLLRAREAGDVADRRHQSHRDREIDAGDRHQPLDRRIVQHTLRNLAVEEVEVLAKAVKLADVPLDRGALVVGQGLARQPHPPRAVEQIRVRALRNQVRMQDRIHLVLEPRPVPHYLVASRHQPAQPLGGGIRCPDFGQIPRCVQACQCPRVDLAGLHMGMCDRLHLQRVGDRHPLHEGRQHA